VSPSRRIGAVAASFILDYVQPAEDVVYSVTVNRTAQRRLCEAAKISPVPDWRDEGTAEPDLFRITKVLTGLEFTDLVKPEEVLRRDPYVCAVCARTFTLAEFRQARHAARTTGRPNPFNPFTKGHPVHVNCGTEVQ
jgi:hypothetical protein